MGAGSLTLATKIILHTLTTIIIITIKLTMVVVEEVPGNHIEITTTTDERLLFY